MSITREDLAGLELVRKQVSITSPLAAEQLDYLIAQAQAAPVAEAVAYIRETDLTRLSQPHVSGCAASLSKRPGDGWLGIYTHPHDAELVELLRSKFPRIDPCAPVPLDEKAHCCEYTIYVERERLHREIDTYLSTLPRT